jgi:rhodanese-related sulfurtransferase/rubrerythrin
MIHPLRFFQPVESLSADKAREFVRRHGEGTFVLLDVRQPGEYEKGHIPGARLFPLSGLLDSLDDLDLEQPTLVYCSTGGRSRIAAQVLSARGFREVYHLDGGISAWHGRTAEGAEDRGLQLIHGDEDPLQIIRLSYGMEDGMAAFYRTVADGSPNGRVKELALRLAAVEERHKSHLVEIVEAEGLDAATITGQLASGIVEGGFDVQDFLAGNKVFAAGITDVLDLSLILETQALDLYLRLAQHLENERAKQVLFEIANEEKGHLAALGALRNEHV